MKRRGRNEHLINVYKKAFEESFFDNYKAWQDTLLDVNNSIEAVSAACKKKRPRYAFDDFCKLTKLVIDERLDALDWEKLIARCGPPGKRKGTQADILRQMAIMETEILFTCFERALLKSIGPRLYKLYRSEIEQYKEEEVVLL